MGDAVEKQDNINIKEYIKDRVPLSITSILTAVVIYGVRLSNENFGIDTSTYLVSGQDQFLNNGRWGITLLQTILVNPSSNIIFITWMSVVFLVFSAISWNYVFFIYSKQEHNNRKQTEILEIVFSVFYISSPVWTEWIYFSLSSFAIFFGVALCPWVVLSLFNNAQNIIRNQKRIPGDNSDKACFIITALLVTLELSIYQALLLLLCSGTAAVFLINKGYYSGRDKRKTARNAGFYIIGVFIAGILIYFLVDLLIIKTAFHIQDSGYIGGTFTAWDHPKMLAVAGYIYKVLFADIAPLNRFIDPLIRTHSVLGEQSVVEFHNMARSSCILYFPALLGYIYDLFSRKSAYNIWYRFVGVAFLILVLLPALVGTGDPQIRVQLSLAFSGPFLLIHTVFAQPGFTNLKKRTVQIWTILILAGCWFQIQKSTALISSDQVRFKEDVELTEDLSSDIYDMTGKEDSKRLLIIGGFQPDHNKEFIQGELLGKSCFYYNCWQNPTESTFPGVNFMNALGHQYKAMEANDPEISTLRQLAENMDSYPAKGYMKVWKDYIVIKLSDSKWLCSSSE